MAKGMDEAMREADRLAASFGFELSKMSSQPGIGDAGWCARLPEWGCGDLAVWHDDPAEAIRLLMEKVRKER